MGEAKRRGNTTERIHQAQSNKYAGLLGLSVAITGSEVDMDTVQILDPAPYEKIANWMMQGLAKSVQTKVLDFDLFKTAGWVQEDGSLQVRLIHKNAVNDEFRIPKEHWCLASAEVLEEASRKLDTPESADLAEQLATIALDINAKRLAEPRKPTAMEIADQVDSVLIVIGSATAGVHFLNSMAQSNPDLSNAADAWIAEGSKYLTIPLGRKEGIVVSKIEMAAAESELMRVLSDKASDSAQILRTGLSIVGVDEATQQIAYDYWTSKGGKVVLGN